VRADDHPALRRQERLSRRTLLRALPLAAVGGSAAGFAVGAEPALAEAPPRSAIPTPGSGSVGTQVVFRGAPGRRRIALTFDDGPSPRWTPIALALLARHGIPATFFIVGSRAVRYPDLVQAVLAAGHQLGNHTWDHLDLVTHDPVGVQQQLGRTHELLHTITGSALSPVRPPWGRIDPVGLLAAAELGCQVVLWSNVVRGAHAQADTTSTLRVIGPGAIVLAHDGGPTPRAVLYEQLDRLVTELQGRGYEFTTVAELSSPNRASPMGTFDSAPG
jgi:peptidoglycan/xylan/chitin deacetylase (PgdA/CDA1 family)